MVTPRTREEMTEIGKMEEMEEVEAVEVVRMVAEMRIGYRRTKMLPKIS